MAGIDDLPIAIRRTRRSNAGRSSAGVAVERSNSSSKCPNTPQRTSKRRVRFSDPGPLLSGCAAGSSTGLTPMVRRTSLAKSTPSTRRRQSTPARTSTGHGLATPFASSPLSGEVHFLPLRQVLDGRIQRRIRRNGLSEEMNIITEEKRRQARKTKEDINTLRAQLKEKDDEIYQLQNATIELDTDRIWELEKQVEELREQLELDNRTVENSRTIEWTLAARDPFAPDFMDMAEDADDFGDATRADLVCGTPSRGRSSFLSPPLTSPALPATPSHSRAFLPPTPAARDSGVQADLPDPEKHHMEEEMASLQLEVAKLTSTLESYTSLTDRLSARLASFTPPDSPAQTPTPETQHQALEAKINTMLQTLSDRAAAMVEVTSSLTTLGFPGTDASEMIASLTSGFRTARLELEYLTPGEIALPLTSRGAEVLDLLLSRLRDLATKARQDEASIDEYHDLELSLRQQLGARVAAMDALSSDLTKARSRIAQSEQRVAELEVSVDRLKGATTGYVRDVRELEALVSRMEAEQRDALAAKDARIESDARALRARDESVAALEGKVAEAVTQTEALLKEMEEVEAARAEANGRAGGALALRDARVAELRGEVDRVNASLRGAHETIKDLRVSKAGVERRLAEEQARAEAVVDAMREEMERVVKEGRERLASPVKGAAQGSEGILSSPLAEGVEARRGSMFGGDLARNPSKSRKRRRYDSGLGFLEEDEVDL